MIWLPILLWRATVVVAVIAIVAALALAGVGVWYFFG